MADRVIINLATGLEDPERVTVAFLVGTAALNKGMKVSMFLTKEAVRLVLPGHAQGVACDGCPPLPRLFEQYAEGGGEFLTCPYCFTSRALDEETIVANATLGGASPMFDWIGENDTLVFSY